MASNPRCSLSLSLSLTPPCSSMDDGSHLMLHLHGLKKIKSRRFCFTMCQSGSECSSQISSLWREQRGKRGGAGMVEQKHRDPSRKKSFAAFYESCICPVGLFYRSLTATRIVILNEEVSHKAGRVTGWSHFSAQRSPGKSRLCALEFLFLGDV